MAVVKGTTKSGFEFEVDTDCFDMRLIKAMRKMTSNVIYYDEVFERILGEEQQDRLYDHLEKLYGKASTEKADDEMADIFEQLNAGKNS